jgi:hypothetical protein
MTAEVPASVGHVFFDPGVADPFLGTYPLETVSHAVTRTSWIEVEYRRPTTTPIRRAP